MAFVSTATTYPKLLGKVFQERFKRADRRTLNYALAAFDDAFGSLASSPVGRAGIPHNVSRHRPYGRFVPAVTLPFS
jgi:hypothetical protein